MTLRALLLSLLVFLTAIVAPAPIAAAALVGPPEEVADGLEVPWEVVLMPDGRTLVTERPGRVRSIEAGGGLRTVYEDTSAVKFLGMALHPDYATNRLVYLYATFSTDANVLNSNRVIRLYDNGTNLVSQGVVFQEGIRSDGNHDGGRMAFGPDGKLYVTTGDVHRPELPQDLDSLNGKILRLDVPGGPGDGAAPPDNPFNAAGESRLRRFVWSYGHRHPQGIDWDACGRMWSTEHGPTGEGHADGLRYRDEINRIDPGANYGWPTIMGDETAPGMRSPVTSSGNSTTWAPGGLAFGSDGRLYAPLLAAQKLLDFGTAGDAITDRRELFGGPERLRDATVGRGYLWLTTNTATAGERVLRVRFDSAGPSAEALAACPPAAPTPTPLPSAPGPLPEATISLKDALLRWSRRMRGVGLRRLARQRSVRLRMGDLPAGTLALRLELPRRGKKALLMARATGTGEVVTLRLTKAGRGALRRRRRPALLLVLRARLDKAAGESSRRSRKLVVRARAV